MGFADSSSEPLDADGRIHEQGCDRDPKDCFHGCRAAADELSQETQEQGFAAPEALRKQYREMEQLRLQFDLVRSAAKHATENLKRRAEQAEAANARVRGVIEAIDADMRMEPDAQRAAMQLEAITRIRAALNDKETHVSDPD